MATCGDGVRVAYPLFHEEGDGSTPISPLQLFFRPIDLTTAKRLNQLWHSRLPRVGRFLCRVAYAAEFAGRFFAVAIWMNPVARLLPQHAWLELNRFAIAPDAPKNTASRMLGWMARDIRLQFPEVERLISYQDLDVHDGTIYRACGWVTNHERSGDDWERPNRVRIRSQSASPKRRWEKVIRASVHQSEATPCSS
jgi:hypothetical protein